ncbi:MAG: hypothetical protein WC273_00395 [Dehalococcoidia bacterium]
MSDVVSALQLDIFGPIAGIPDPPWPPALVCEPYGSAGNWRIRCSLPGHDPGFGLWGGSEQENRILENSHRWWHETNGGRPAPESETPGVCTAWTPEGACGWSAANHLAQEPAHLQPTERLARVGAYRGIGADKTWHVYSPEVIP